MRTGTAAIQLFYAWYDLYIGAYYNRRLSTLYLVFLGLGISIDFHWLFYEWDSWRSSWNEDDHKPPVMRIKHIFRCRWFGVDLHKFCAADAPMCYHTHPYYALRFVLWGGYVEEQSNGHIQYWEPGSGGIVKPEFDHRVERLLKENSYSLWIHGPIKYKVRLVGKGWKNHNQGR